MSTQIMLVKSHGRIGVSCEDSPSPAGGALVTALCENSIAHRAGLNVGDRIVTVNGRLIQGHAEAIEEIDAAPDRVALVLERPTRRVKLDKARGRIGVTLSNVGCGVQVCALEEGSLALQAGLFVGDTIVSINGALATAHEEAVAMIDASRVVEFAVVACTRQLVLPKGAVGTLVGVTVADRLDGGAGVVVIGLQPGGTAIRHLQLGDTLLACDGVLVSTHREAIERIDDARGRLTLVVGERCADLSQVLRSVDQSTSVGEAAVEAPGCEPVFTRHAPLHERSANAF